MKNLRKKINKLAKISARYRGGVSIIEILVIAGITATIVFTVVSFRSNLGSLENFVNQRLQSSQDIKQTMQILTTEIRSAGPSSLGSYPIESASTSSVTFYSDIDKDGLFERVRYFLFSNASGTVIKKGVIRPAGNPLVYATSSEIITTAISNVIVNQLIPLFKFYDSAFTGSQAPLSPPIDATKIRIVQLSVYADINPTKTPKAEFFMTTVAVRNVRSN